MIIDYLFYRLYNAITYTSYKEMPVFTTIIMFSLLLNLNIIAIINLIYMILSIPVPEIISNPNKIIFLLFILFFTFGIYFGKHKRKIIYDRFKNESKRQKKLGNYILLFYIFVTILLFGTLIFFRNREYYHSI